MSPFLFAIAMEYLSRNLRELKHVKEFKYHPQCAKLGVTHLCFADDLLLFSKGDVASVRAMQRCFQIFSNASGLQANLGKSTIYFGGVSQDTKDAILQQWGLTIGDLPFKYLGVPLSTKKLSTLQWYPLIEKIIAKISTWTAKKLAYAGRVQLVQSVLFGVQSYWAQLFLIPSKILKLINGYCRSFIWSGAKVITKKSLVSWEKMCSPISAGGLNLTHLQKWNQAAVTKLCWNLAHKEDKLWIKWIRTYYIKNRDLRDWPIPQQASRMTRKIMAAKDLLLQLPATIVQKTLIRQYYLQLLGELPRVQWKSLMFGNQARPKARFIMWLTLQQRLLTTDRLIKWGDCPVSTWEEILAWSIKRAKGKSQTAKLFKMVFTEYTYAIWIERNQRLFEQKSKSVETIAKDLAYICNVRAPLDI
ncbi:hypothetical protein KY284_012677 [Solanum tuberosum]|nr:hypothetical protein KY284_012677 [Solanum tuberosum]